MSKPLKFGPFPHELVNRLLGTELEPGNAYFGPNAQRHAEKRHPKDFPIILPRIEDVVLRPMWVGQSPHHADSIELVRRITLASSDVPPILDRYIALAAVEMDRDRFGDYRIASAYLIDQRYIDMRLLAQRLFAAK